MVEATDKPVHVAPHEGSPLMATSRSEEHGTRPHVVDESSKSVWYLILLTLSIGGYVLFPY